MDLVFATLNFLEDLFNSRMLLEHFVPESNLDNNFEFLYFLTHIHTHTHTPTHTRIHARTHIVISLFIKETLFTLLTLYSE